jgi:hypothetical protein
MLDVIIFFDFDTRFYEKYWEQLGFFQNGTPDHHQPTKQGAVGIFGLS